MTEQLVVFETAKLAKEKGFNVNTDSEDYKHDFYCIKDFENDWRDSFSKYKVEDLIEGYYLAPLKNKIEEVVILAPPQSLLKTWLRQIHNLHVTPVSDKNGSWECWIYNLTAYGDVTPWDLEDVQFKTYEDALEKGLQEALNLLPNI